MGVRWNAGRAVPALLLAALATGCAPMVMSVPASLDAASPQPRAFTLTRDVPVELSTGYTRVIPSGSRWREAGRLPQGTVYRPLDTVFAIEGRQVHEAYLVIDGQGLEGFYLPGEARFSTLDNSIRLPMGEPR